MSIVKLLFSGKRGVPTVLVIVFILLLQAYCDLSLPRYTAWIVDIGIMQGGIADAVPEMIRRPSLDELEMFMPERDIRVVEAYYHPEGGGDVMKLDMGAEGQSSDAVRKKLNSIFEAPMLIAAEGKGLAGAAGPPAGAPGAAEAAAPGVSAGAIDVAALAAGYRAGSVTKEGLMQVRAEADKSVGRLGDIATGAASVAYVKAEYEALGVDLGKVQSDYMKSTALLMLLLTLGSALAAAAVCFIASYRAAGVGMRLRRDMFFNILGFSGREMGMFSSASLITRSTNDIQQIQIALVMFMRLMLLAPVMGAGGIIMVISTHSGMGWIAAAAVGILLGIVAFLLKFMMPKFKLMQSLIDRVNLVSRETLTGLPVIRAFCKEGYEMGRFGRANNELTETQLYTSRTMSLMFPILMFVMNIVSVAIIWFGGIRVDEGHILVGDMMAFITYTVMIVMSFMMISFMAIILPRANVAAERIEEVLAVKSSIADKPEGDLVRRDEWRGRVAFEDVSFRFPDADEDVLHGISFGCEPGQTTAIIGSTGSGKSTLVNLVPRIFDVTGGRVTIDGVDVRDMALRDLRGLVGVVPQKGFLFSGDIASNIRYGRADATDAEVEKAAGIAQAAAFITEKQEGYASGIASGGDNVSGGQKQRLAIARALAKDPRALIFDDSFSALDYRTDTELRRALEREMSGRTVI
ncbi:MAG: ABC transporter ATP-binding protein/permease, partial [Clostridiales Family XIII bacterium]|nr:ABC transporter ATP-binding protein/permease [Clostridiales Family XIII bacterium]